MDVREKLVKLLGSVSCNGNGESLGSCPDRKYGLCGEVANLSYCVIQNTANHLIANGVTVQEWISASKPPKERGCYLISVKHWLDGKPVTREAFWNGADWLSCYWKKGDRVELTPRVTHWQYLPQPPKGE